MTGPVTKRARALRAPVSIWLSLISLVLGVFVLGGVFALAMWRNQVEDHKRDAAQDKAMCELIRALTAGPAPAPGPAGDRARALLPLMTAVRDSVCERDRENREG
jgi:hypothetical protein